MLKFLQRRSLYYFCSNKYFLPKELYEDPDFVIHNPEKVVQKQILKQLPLRKFTTLDDLQINLDVPDHEILHLMRLVHQDKPFQTNKIPKEMVEPILPFFLSESVNDQIPKKQRPPIVTIMGHVDHGKTTLLDYLRKSSIAQGEYGGITQKIGAFHVNLTPEKRITFIDTPGHEAFTNMRMRGAQFTDFIILVVSAQDGVQPQTLEVVSIAYNLQIPIIVAINKIDVAGSAIQEVEEELVTKAKLGLEGYKDGNIPVIHISAKTGLNMDMLLELIEFQSELMELTAQYECQSQGFVLESRQQNEQDGRGSTLVVLKGTLHVGDQIIINDQLAKIRQIRDDLNTNLKCAFPSYAVEIQGLKKIPTAGELFFGVENELLGKLIIQRIQEKQEEERMKNAIILEGKAGRIKIKNKREKRKVYSGDKSILKGKLDEMKEKIEEEIFKLQEQLEEMEEDEENNEKRDGIMKKIGELYKKIEDQKFYIQEVLEEIEDKKELNLIIKGQDYGTVETIKQLLERVIQTELEDVDFEVNIISTGVGNITLKDIKDAKNTNSQIIAMNVNMGQDAQKLARQLDVNLHQHQIIYALMDDIKSMIEAGRNKAFIGKDEKVHGRGVILNIFELKTGKIGSRKVYGGKCIDGSLHKKMKLRVVRNGMIVASDITIANLKHFKEEKSEIKEGMECGIGIVQNIELKINDEIECYSNESK